MTDKILLSAQSILPRVNLMLSQYHCPHFSDKKTEVWETWLPRGHTRCWSDHPVVSVCACLPTILVDCPALMAINIRFYLTCYLQPQVPALFL